MGIRCFEWASFVRYGFDLWFKPFLDDLRDYFNTNFAFLNHNTDSLIYRLLNRSLKVLKFTVQFFIGLNCVQKMIFMIIFNAVVAKKELLVRLVSWCHWLLRLKVLCKSDLSAFYFHTQRNDRLHLLHRFVCYMSCRVPLWAGERALRLLPPRDLRGNKLQRVPKGQKTKAKDKQLSLLFLFLLLLDLLPFLLRWALHFWPSTNLNRLQEWASGDNYLLVCSLYFCVSWKIYFRSSIAFCRTEVTVEATMLKLLFLQYNIKRFHMNVSIFSSKISYELFCSAVFSTSSGSFPPKKTAFSRRFPPKFEFPNYEPRNVTNERKYKSTSVFYNISILRQVARKDTSMLLSSPSILKENRNRWALNRMNQ